MNTSRGAVPADFPIQACVDGSNIWLYNTTTLVLRVFRGGDVGKPVTTPTDFSLAVDATRLKDGGEWVMLPGDKLKIPIGSGSAAVDVKLMASAQDFYYLANLVATFFPLGTAVNGLAAFAQFISDINADLNDYKNCKANRNFLGQVGCFARFSANIEGAVSDLGLGLTAAAGHAVLGVLLSAETFTQWVYAQLPQLKTLIDPPPIKQAALRSPQPSGSLWPHLTLTIPPNGTVGTPYSWTATVAPADTYTWSSGANLPPGLSFSAAGVLSGVPTQAGTFTFEVTATTKSQRYATAPVTVTINSTSGGGTGSWNIQVTPNQSAGSGNQLQGVSCTSPTSCIAVGYYFASPSSNYPSPLAERWDGSTWAVQPMPGLPGSAALEGVSCTSGTSCTAVGHSNNSNGIAVPLAAHWNGSAWSTQTTPNPPAQFGNGFIGVSCASATSCTAVGYSSNSGSTEVALAEHWDGNAWSIQAVPSPSSQIASFNGVSCASATSCTAVGYSDDSSNNQWTLAEHWDGSTWSIQATPIPPGGSDQLLQGISCTSSTNCIAVGGYVANGNWQPLAEHWDGNTWSIQATPPESSGWILYGVSCPSATSCTAVGTYGFGDQAQAEYWNGSTWSAQAVPNPSSGGSFPYNRLNGVSCTSGASFTAVGYYTDTAGTDLTLAEST